MVKETKAKAAAAAADTAGAGAIEGAGAVEKAGGTARDVVAGAIGGAAAGQAEATDQAGGKPEEEDHVSAHDRHLERLVRIVDEADFESGSLRGDIRDTMLDVIKARPKVWSQTSEIEQRDLIRALDAVTTGIIKKIVFVLAEQDDLSVHCKLKGYSVDGEDFKLKLTAKGDLETATQLFKLDGHEVVLISADSKRYQGARKDPEIMPDQPGLQFEGGEGRTEPLAPAASSTETDDLNPGGDKVGDLKQTRVNLVEGTIEDSVDGKTWSFVRDATPEELGAARDAQDDFSDGDE